MKFKMLSLLAGIVGTMLAVSMIDVNAQMERSEPAIESVDEVALLRSLAERFVGVSSIPDSELIVGQLPDAFPIESLPMPEGSQLLGSVVRHNDFIEVYIDAEQSADEIEALYENQLVSAGWSASNFPEGMWRILTATATVESPEMISPPIYCSPAGDLMVQLTAWEVELTGLTDVRLSISPDRSVMGSSVCNSSVEFPFLPTLQLPAGVELSTAHSGNRENFVYTDVAVSTQMTRDALLSHLGEQFEQAGWTLVDQMNEDILSWSSWTFDSEQGDAWTGSLNVIELRGVTDEYLIRAQAKKD